MSYKEIYKEAVNELNPSPELIHRIKRSKENKIVKFSKKKIAIVAVIACMAIGTTALAAGRISTYLSWSDNRTESRDYASVEAYLDKEEVNAAIPENLSNGYAFASSNTGGTRGQDENGNTLAEGEFFAVTYQKADSQDLYLNIDPAFETEDRSGATEIREINGTTVYYNKDIYKMVPSNYERTKEDDLKEKAGHFYVSCGADKVELQTLDSIVFEMDGKVFNLISFDNTMSTDEWFALAADFIG